MAKLYECPVEGCDHSPFKTSQALNSHIRNVHHEYEGGGKGAREVPIVEEDFTTAELVRDKRMDIMRKANSDILLTATIFFVALRGRY